MKCKFIKFKLILLLVISIFLLGSFVVTAQSIKKGKPISKMNTDLFHLKLNYEINTVSNTPRFNGAISSTQWRTKAGPRNAYTYHYDSRDQLVEANYWEATNSAQYVKSNEFQTAPITYDLNGNILSLKRQDELNSLIIDDLSYVYEVDNQLLSIEEVGDLTEGFHADQSVNTYQYDLNGNLISDQSKNITNIEYNHLNLPAIIKFSDGSELQFTYNASGKKIRKRYLLSSSQTIKDYCHEIEYYNNSLEAIYHENGRSVSNTSDWQEEFFIADHLGSPRVYFADLNDNYKIESSELLQEQHYYPFGMTIPDATAQVGIENPYQYNNKEFSGESNLNWYDYGARYYDPAIGRWGQVDPMAEKYLGLSLYGYVANNPMLYTDPDGEEIYIYYNDPETGVKRGYIYGSGNPVPNSPFLKTTIATLDELQSSGADVLGIISKMAAPTSRGGSISEGVWYEHMGTAGNHVAWSPQGGIVTNRGGRRSPAVGLLHEIAHWYYAENIANEPDPQDPDYLEKLEIYEQNDKASAGAYDNLDDKWVIEDVENPAARKLRQATRHAHSYKTKYKALHPFSLEGPTLEQLGIPNHMKRKH